MRLSRLPKPLRYEGWLSHYGSLRLYYSHTLFLAHRSKCYLIYGPHFYPYGSLLFSHPILGTWPQWLFAIWNTLISIWKLKYSILSKVQETVRLPKLLRRESWLSYYRSLWPLQFAHSILGPSLKGLFATRSTILTIWVSKIRNLEKFMRMSDCLKHCVAKADCHIKEAFGLYYSHTLFWAHSSKGYLLHGPHFYSYMCWNIQNWAKFMRVLDCLTHPVARADCHIMETLAFYHSNT